MREFKLESFSAEEDILNKGLGRNKPNISFGGDWDWGVPFVGGTSLDPNTDHSIWDASNWSENFGFGGSDSSLSEGTSESGGLTEEDKAMKAMFYKEIKKLFDQEYKPYTGDRYTNRSQDELDVLSKLKEGGGYQDLYDEASGKLDAVERDLGFTSDVYKDAAGYDIDRLSADASRLMDESSVYRDKVADTTMRQMTEAASRMGMINRGNEVTGGTAWGDRAPMLDMYGRQNYLTAAGDQLSKMNLGAYQDSLNRARQLNLDQQGAAGRYASSRKDYGNTALQNLGIGTGGLDKHYSTSLGAYGQDREYQDRDKGWAYKQWQDEQNYPFKKLAYSSGLYSGMPFEEKTITQQPASGGK